MYVNLALELAPDDPAVHRKRSLLFLVGGATDKALASALTAIELAPDRAEGYVNLGRVYQAKIREHRLADEEVPEELYRSAIEAFERGDSSELSVSALVEKARTYASWPGHREEGSAAFREALERAVELEDHPRRLMIAEEIALRARRLGADPSAGSNRLFRPNPWRA